MELRLKNQKIPCEILKRKRKTIEIQVQKDGSLRILAPKGLRKENIREALKEKENWILKNVREVRDQGLPETAAFNEGELHYGFGKLKPLCFRQGSKDKGLEVRLTMDGFIISGADFSKALVKKALEDWYRLQTKKRIGYYVKKYRNSLPRPTAVQVKTQKKRWGSCNHKGKVMFNWKLSMTPAWVLEYLVVHELSHVEEFNHSKRFWSLVEKTYPKWDEARRWLKEHQYKLNSWPYDKS